MIRSIDCAIDTRRFDRLLRRFEREIARGLIGRGEVPGVDAGARHDPFVARLDALLRETVCQILIRDAVRRQVAARAEHA